jgi:hypothetical protein
MFFVKLVDSCFSSFKVSCRLPGVFSRVTNPFDEVLELSSVDARVENFFNFVDFFAIYNFRLR